MLVKHLNLVSRPSQDLLSSLVHSVAQQTAAVQYEQTHSAMFVSAPFLLASEKVTDKGGLSLVIGKARPERVFRSHFLHEVPALECDHGFYGLDVSTSFHSWSMHYLEVAQDLCKALMRFSEDWSSVFRTHSMSSDQKEYLLKLLGGVAGAESDVLARAFEQERSYGYIQDGRLFMVMDGFGYLLYDMPAFTFVKSMDSAEEIVDFVANISLSKLDDKTRVQVQLMDKDGNILTGVHVPEAALFATRAFHTCAPFPLESLVGYSVCYMPFYEDKFTIVRSYDVDEHASGPKCIIQGYETGLSRDVLSLNQPWSAVGKGYGYLHIEGRTTISSGFFGIVNIKINA